MTRLLRTTILGMVVAMLVSPAVCSAESIEPNEMLAQAEALAREVRRDASILQTYVRFPMMYSNESHEQRLLMMKRNTNDLGDIIQKLHKNRKQLSDWQGELVTRLLPKMDTMTDEVENAIRFVDENQSQAAIVARPIYEDYVDGSYTGANAIVRSIDRFRNWADHNTKISQTR